MSEDVLIAEEDVRKGLPSASGLERLVLCPGSWQAEARCPEDGVSEAAAVGTRLHRDMELGTMPEDAEEAEAVVWCREMEEALAEELLGCRVELFREKRLWDNCQRFSGQADVVYHNERAALVLDYKFGRAQVAAARKNCQLYGLGLLVMDNFAAFDVVYAGCLQPFVSRQRPQLVRFVRGEAEGLRRFIYGALDKAAAEDAVCVSGVVQCKYCRAAAVCPAHGLRVQQVSGLELKRWEDWGAEDRRRAWDAARLARRWAEAVERRVRADLEDGVELPGLQLAPGKAVFTVTDAAGAFGVLNAMLGISGEEFARCCKVGVTELDKLVHGKLAEQAPEGVKQTTKASREWLRGVLEDYGSVKCSAGSIKEQV